MKTVPVVNLDSYQDDDIQELAGGRPAAPGTDEPVAVSRPREPGDGVILLSAKRIASTHQPVLISTKPDVIECSTDEEEIKVNLGSPSYCAPDVIDDPEYGQPQDPLNEWYSSVSSPAPAIALAVDHRDCDQPVDQVAKANPDSHQENSAPQEEAGESLQSRNPDRGSALTAVLVDCTSKRETTLALSLPPPRSPCNADAQPEVLPDHPVSEEDPSVTDDPATELQDSSGTRKQDPSGQPELESVGREKGPQLEISPLEYSHFFLCE